MEENEILLLLHRLKELSVFGDMSEDVVYTREFEVLGGEDLTGGGGGPVLVHRHGVHTGQHIVGGKRKIAIVKEKQQPCLRNEDITINTKVFANTKLASEC